MRLEMHIHTKFSHDSLMCFWALYMKCRLSKIDYVAVTEHNNIVGAIEFQKYCKNRGDKIKVIIGEEILTNCGEIIGLYLVSPIEPGLSPEETINAIQAQGGIVYIPHPYDEKRKETVLCEELIKDNADKIDCIECHNGRNISTRFSDIQNSIAEENSLTKVVGSDAHTVFEVGRNYIETKIPPNDPDSFRQAVSNPVLRKRPCIKICHHFTKFDRIIKMLIEGKYHELYRIVNRKIRK